MADEQVKETINEQVTEQVNEQPQVEQTPQIETNPELEKLKLENEQLKTQLARAEFEKDEAQKAFLNNGKEVTPPRDYKSIVDDIE